MSTPGYPQPPHSQPTYVGPAGPLPPPGPPGPGGPPQPGRHQPPRRRLHPLAIVGIVVGGLVAVCCIGVVVVAVANPDAFEDGVNDGLAADATETSDAAPSPTEAALATPSAAPAPSTAPEPSPEPTRPPRLTIPEDLVGMNAAIAEDRLHDLGFSNIDFGSVDQNDTVVLVPANWTVVGVEPAPGSKTRADSLIILSCSKQ